MDSTARSPGWHPVDRDAFRTWLSGLPANELLGMAGGYTRHPVAYYLNARDPGFWCLEIGRKEVRILDRRAPEHRFYNQAGWLLAFCWELKSPDSYRSVTAADCLTALENVP